MRERWQVRAHHIRGKLMTRQVLDVLMVRVDDFCEFAPVHRLLEHPHVDGGVKPVVLGRVGAHDLSDGRAPMEAKISVRSPQLLALVLCQWALCVLA